MSWRKCGLVRENCLHTVFVLVQSCERLVEEVGQPLAIAGVDNMARLVSAMTREWEIATHNATMAAAQVPASCTFRLAFLSAFHMDRVAEPCQSPLFSKGRAAFSPVRSAKNEDVRGAHVC